MTEYSKEQLNQLNKDELIQLVLSRQTEMLQMDRNIQLILEQLADSKRHRFGRSTEKLEMDQQISFQEIDGTIVFFNEAEAIVDEEAAQDEKTAKTKVPRPRGKRERDLKDLPVEIIAHTMPEEQLVELFGENGWKRLPDESSRRQRCVPAEIKVEEHHIAVFRGKKVDKSIRADHPQPLLKGSLVSESLEAAILNAKYVNALPFYRQEREFERYGVHISRQDMANWTIQCAERYLAIMYDYLHSKLYTFSVLQADETTVFVNKDGRPAGSKSYMWLYRTVESVQKEQILLYEYQKTRNSNHPRTFLKSFHGICITDGYQVYHTLEQEREDLQIAGCWAHVRRRYDEALKALPKEKRNQSTAHRGLVMIQAIYRNEKSALDQVKNYVIEGFNLWGGGAAELYKDDKGESRLITTGDQANVSSQAASGNNLCPYRMTEKNNTMYNGYTWTPACFLYPIVFSDFMLSSPDGDVNNSPIYQNPGWPIEDGASALELPN